MNEQTFEQQLKSELQARAERVRPSADAWTRIQERADASSRRNGWAVGLGLVGAAGAAGALAVNVLQAPESVIIDQEPAGPAAVTEAPTAPPATATEGEGATGGRDEEPTVYEFHHVGLPGDAAFVSAEGIASVGQTVMVVGDDGDTGLPVTWLSRDGGESFQLISPEEPQAGEWKDVLAFEGRFLLAGQTDGRPSIQVFDPASGQWSPGYTGDASGVLYALAAGPAGPVATGNVSTPAGRTGLAVALDDGSTWSEVTDQPGFGGPETVLYHATATDAGYVAAGYGPAGQVDTWFSTDGRAWEHLGSRSGQGIRGSGGVVDALAADPATGTFWAVQAGGSVWRSTDGRVWEAAPRLPAGEDATGFRAPAALVDDGGLLAFAGRDGAMGVYRVDDQVTGLAETAGRSLTTGAGATRLDDGTVMVPLSGPDGRFVWRGVPR